MTDIISDEKLDALRFDAEACDSICRNFESEAHVILSLLARLDKAEGELSSLRQTIVDADIICDDGGKSERFITGLATSIRARAPDAETAYRDMVDRVNRMTDKEMAELSAAYVRGAKWSLEMGMRYTMPELRKAAYDYADKATSPVSSVRNLADAPSKSPLT